MVTKLNENYKKEWTMGCESRKWITTSVNNYIVMLTFILEIGLCTNMMISYVQ